ncbi:shikimate kinase [Anatilimnocola floriformis]|uniref:shikimate kinase n=1 Tax=Anatilimnocola floriformis TaxID=2948575 RepID=UPI0020C4C937|nr:shikimate kinase [Anatilimnocola floriformis]
MSNLYLIGYRGCGKTTVARLLDELLRWTAIDADEHLEQAAGKTIREIFAAEGEAGFRDRESDTVRELSQRTDLIVSWGGGVILREANRAALRAAGKIVWLKARPETLLQRIEQDPTTGERRPNLTAAGGIDEVRHLLTIREPLYTATADTIVEVDDISPPKIAAVIADWFQSQEGDRS